MRSLTARDALAKADKVSDATKDVNVSTSLSTIEWTRRRFADAAAGAGEREVVEGGHAA